THPQLDLRSYERQFLRAHDREGAVDLRVWEVIEGVGDASVLGQLNGERIRYELVLESQVGRIDIVEEVPGRIKQVIVLEDRVLQVAGLAAERVVHAERVEREAARGRRGDHARVVQSGGCQG